MKQSTIDKTMSTSDITQEHLAQISRYTRREMNPEELFVFSLLLCDNEVDRDGERFPTDALDKLGELFLGKTGIFDHLPRAENQSARIFATELVKDGQENSVGEPYTALKAWAYMVRCPKNLDLILEIDGGIKKEISVGCAVGEILCSVCGTNQKEEGCSHKKGESYNGVACHYLLHSPTDAYEWSFVAIPAQRKAGVVKGYGGTHGGSGTFLDRLGTTKGSLTLSHDEAVSLKAYLEDVAHLAKAGGGYMEELRGGIIRNASKVHPKMNCAVLEEICQLMSFDQLTAFHKSYEDILLDKGGLSPQLLGEGSQENTTTQESFKI